MNKLKLFITLIIFFAFGLGGLFLSKSNAQEANYDVTVSPVFFDLSANPGGTINDKIRIRNNTTSPLPIKLTVKKLSGDLNGEITLKNDDSDNTTTWIKFNEDSFVANPLEWTDVPFSIDIPENAAYGYYFAISFEQDDTSPLARTGAKITGAAAVPILLNVRKEGAKAQAKLLEFSIKDKVLEYLPAEFNIKLQNTGNVHIRPHGNIFISNGSGSDVATLDVNAGLANIIPNTQRSFTSSWVDGFIVRENVLENGQLKLDENGNPITQLKINWNKLTSFRIGKYSANLLLVYDNGNRDVTLESTLSFWVIPYKAIGAIILFILVLIIVVRFILKYYISKEVKKRLPKS